MTEKVKILYIHNEKKRVKYGAHYFNDLVIKKLRDRGFIVDSIFPQENINLLDRPLSGIKNILFFYSLISKKNEIESYDIIQGTTYTTLAFLGNNVPVVSHFGSTCYGFIKSVPSKNVLREENENLANILEDLKRYKIINSTVPLVKPVHDVSKIEIYVAKKSDAIIASSGYVKYELVKNNISPHKIFIIHNAIEDYWFKSSPIKKVKPIANLVYLGRMGEDPFTVKLKGITRLIYVLRNFSSLKKIIIGLTSKFVAYEDLFKSIPNTKINLNIAKRKIPNLLKSHYGDIFIYPGRYEGFCLSLIEAMSQGLVPIIFSIGVAPEIIENGKNGYIVSSLKHMVQKINYLSKRPRVRARMAEVAIETSKNFNSDILIDKYARVYEYLINKNINKKTKNEKSKKINKNFASKIIKYSKKSKSIKNRMKNQLTI